MYKWDGHSSKAYFYEIFINTTFAWTYYDQLGRYNTYRIT